MGVKLLSVIVCDEVRREASGDAIIIGARQSGPAIPGHTETTIDRLALYVELETTYPPPKVVALRLYNSQNETTVIENKFENNFETEIDVPEEADARGVMLLVVNRVDVDLPGAGEYCVQFRELEEEWQDARTFVFPTWDGDDRNKE